MKRIFGLAMFLVLTVPMAFALEEPPQERIYPPGTPGESVEDILKERVEAYLSAFKCVASPGEDHTDGMEISFNWDIRMAEIWLKSEPTVAKIQAWVDAGKTDTEKHLRAEGLEMGVRALRDKLQQRWRLANGHEWFASIENPEITARMDLLDKATWRARRRLSSYW